MGEISGERDPWGAQLLLVLMFPVPLAALLAIEVLRGGDRFPALAAAGSLLLGSGISACFRYSQLEAPRMCDWGQLVILPSLPLIIFDLLGSLPKREPVHEFDLFHLDRFPAVFGTASLVAPGAFLLALHMWRRQRSVALRSSLFALGVVALLRNTTLAALGFLTRGPEPTFLPCSVLLLAPCFLLPPLHLLRMLRVARRRSSTRH